jgi:hypothetical protein
LISKRCSGRVNSAQIAASTIVDAPLKYRDSLTQRRKCDEVNATANIPARIDSRQ